MIRKLAQTLALLIAVAPAPTLAGEKVELEGYAEYREGDALVVDGQLVRATSRTRLKLKGRAHSFESIPLGYEVKVKGTRDANGMIIASRVEAKRNGDAMFEEDLKRSFDQSEAMYLKRGRMYAADGAGRIVQDYGELLDSGPEVRRVRTITRRLVPSYLEADDFRVYVVDNDEWNAMAGPNGSIFVFSGLLRDLDDDEVAIVLGHELAHATHEHSRRQYKRGIFTNMAAIGASAVAGQTIGSTAGRTAAEYGIGLASSAWSNGYGREHEDQADRVGMRYAYEAGYDVSKAPKLWQRFADKYGDPDKTVNFFFGNHSVASDRKRNAEAEIEHNYRF